MELGKAIRQERKRQHLTQIELADKAGIAVNSIRLYEAGKRTPRNKQLESIAKALGTTAESLTLQAIDEKEYLSQTAADLAEQIATYEACVQYVCNAPGTPQSVIKIVNQIRPDLERVKQELVLVSFKAVNANANELLLAYEQLNPTGQQEAVRRVKELTYIPEYRKKDTTKNGNPKEESPPE